MFILKFIDPPFQTGLTYWIWFLSECAFYAYFPAVWFRTDTSVFLGTHLARHKLWSCHHTLRDSWIITFRHSSIKMWECSLFNCSLLVPVANSSKRRLFPTSVVLKTKRWSLATSTLEIGSSLPVLLSFWKDGCSVCHMRSVWDCSLLWATYELSWCYCIIRHGIWGDMVCLFVALISVTHDCWNLLPLILFLIELKQIWIKLQDAFLEIRVSLCIHSRAILYFVHRIYPLNIIWYQIILRNHPFINQVLKPFHLYFQNDVVYWLGWYWNIP